MFEALRQAFREAAENFRTELNRDRVPEAVDGLLRAMQNELVDAKVHLDRLREEVTRTEAEAAREEDEAKTCLRREELALRISDTETALVARDFAEKHLRRHDLLKEKAGVLARELAERSAEVDDMMAQVKEARTRRSELAATAGRASARASFAEADDLFAQMDRMAEKISGFESQGAASQEVDELLGHAPRADRPPPSGEVELDDRLAELKRKMGRE